MLKYITVEYIHNIYNGGIHTTVLGDNFPGFACWGNLILSEFQNNFYACSAQPGKKRESGSLFNTKMPESLLVRYCIIFMTITINYMLRLLMNSMLWYKLG